ncbi:MAG TPA: M48 family metallopeptidase [Thermoanaerobaculia bacterium]|jgi:Zn-dependent protease with chaperone function|nr:M48 family metallopeptidase [Thermoanaerobaculia bacterium]
MRNAALAALTLVFALLFTPLAHAQAPAPDPAPAAAGVTAADAPSASVPVPEPSEKALRYYRSSNVLWAISTIWGLLVPLLLLFTGFSARMRDAARKVGRNWFFTVVLYGVLFTLVTAVLSLPLDYYSGFVRPHAYGLSDQTAAKWWSDALIGLGIGCVAVALLLWIPYLLLRRSPRRWWLYSGLTALPLLILLLLITPTVIEPLFNKFGPMENKALESQILTLADRAGIEGGRVYEVNKSVDTKTVNAYVTGLGGTKRIVLWDTILAKLSPPEVLFVMGHEMGHYVLGHTWQLVLLGTVLALFGAWVIHRTAGELIARYRARFGFTELADIASLPLMILLFSIVSLVLTPAILAFGRNVEHEADRFGLEITRDNHDCATAFVKLQQENLSVPRPGLLYKLWRSDHPPLGERIDFCNEYRPWETGAPLKYGDKVRRAQG